MKLAVLCKDGFETIEGLTIVDIFRRAKIDVALVGMDSEFVATSQSIYVKMDEEFNDDIYNYDGVVIPGGLPGATNLQKDERVIKLLQEFDKQHKIIAAICAGPIVLEEARVIDNKHVTCYPGYESQLEHATFVDGLVQQDDNVITGKGPAASLEFGYTVLKAFGVSPEDIKEGMQYNYLMHS